MNIVVELVGSKTDASAAIMGVEQHATAQIVRLKTLAFEVRARATRKRSWSNSLPKRESRRGR
jgi:hypothetical protein